MGRRGRTGRRRPCGKVDPGRDGPAGTWRSLVAHLTGGQGVAGSNPVVPTVASRSPPAGDPRRGGAPPVSEDPADRYLVVRNDEEQYSIWSADREVPAGWQQVGVEGTRQDCLSHIDQVWTDMRPASVRAGLAAPPDA